MTDVAVSVTRRRHSFLMRLANLLLVLVSTGLMLGVIEGVLRLLGHRALYEMYSKPSLFWRYDPLLGWSHEPGARGDYVGPRPWPVEFSAEVSINSLGLRGPEIPALGPSEQRVLVLGDSMVAGFEVPYEDTFEALLERDLTQRLGHTVRVINGGVRGYGTDQSYLYYTHRGRKLHPDVVVFFHSGNDPADNTTVHEMRRPFGKSAVAVTASGEVRLLGSPVPHYPMCSEYDLASNLEITRVDDRPERMLCHAQMLLFDHSALFSLLTISIPWDAALLKRLYYLGNPHSERLAVGHGTGADDTFALRLTTALVRALGHAVRADGASFLVTGEPCCLPQLDRVALASDGIDEISLDGVSRAPVTEVRWQHDSHFKPLGHRMVAEDLRPELEARLRARTAQKVTNR